MESVLILSRGGLPPFSARGCTQELIPIALGECRRTINGELVFLGQGGKKYRSNITCADQTVIATDDVQPGMVVTVQCIQRLWQRVSGGEAQLERDFVPESLAAISEDKHTVEIAFVKDRQIKLHTTLPAFISYRPILNMRVVSYSLKTDEWQLKTSWKLELEEV